MIRAMPGLRVTPLFIFMGILSSLQISFAQRFDVNVIKTPVIVSPGGAASLSCEVSPPVSAEQMTIKFHRGDPKSYVYVYKKSEVDPGTQNEKYKDRTQFLTQNIARGQITLRIKNIQWSDEGDYTCLFASSSHYQAGNVKLQMAVVGKEPTIPQGKDGEVTGPCESSGWYPEPKLQWLDGNKNILESEVSIKYIDETTLYRVSSPLPKNGHSGVTCRISNELLNEEKSVTLSGPTKIIPIAVGTSVAVLVVVLAGVLGVLYQKKKRQREFGAVETKE